MSLGLRTKSLLALLLACLFAVIPTAMLGWRGLEAVREHFGQAFIVDLTDLNRGKILAPLGRELALSQRFAEANATRRWLADEKDDAAREAFLREAAGYGQAFRDHVWFVVPGASRDYYFSDRGDPTPRQPRYSLKETESADAWYFATMKTTDSFNINVDPDRVLNVTKLWINVVVRDGGKKLGLAGTGLDLTKFLNEFIVADQPGVTPMIIDPSGVIQAHPDRRLIAMNSGSGVNTGSQGLFGLVEGEGSRKALTDLMRRAEAAPAVIASAWVVLGGRRQLLADGYIPELHWHVLTALDPASARLIAGRWLWLSGLTLLLLVGLLLAGFGMAVERVVLRPLRGLQQSVQAIAGGNYEAGLPPAGKDEIGDLSRAFGTMSERVREHTTLLESKVRERTAELEGANQAMALASKQINDSIAYASLIQRSILPERQMAETLGNRYALLWRPRETVGGDFYVFRREGDDFLAGVIDCAGHGVPGAMMTLLAWYALDHALTELGPRSPAAILQRVDEAMRALSQESGRSRALATNVDAGLVYVDRAAARVVFAGAKIGLFWTDGQESGEVKGGRRSLGDRRWTPPEDQAVPLCPGRSFAMVTDGFLDQSGGAHGFGFGARRFAALLKQMAHLPVAELGREMAAALIDYQGERPQRDDLTMLCLRPEASAEGAIPRMLEVLERKP